MPITSIADLDRMKTMVNAGKEPWASAFQVLLSDPHSQSNYTLQGPTANIFAGGANGNNNGVISEDAVAAYHNAIMFVLLSDIHSALLTILSPSQVVYNR